LFLSGFAQEVWFGSQHLGFIGFESFSTPTVRTWRSLNHSRRASRSLVKVPKTLGESPAMETWSFSLPTSVAAALESSTGKAFMLGTAAVCFYVPADVRPIVTRRTSLPSGNTAQAASPNNACVDNRNQSHPRAIPNTGTRQRGTRPRCARRLTSAGLSGSGAQSTNSLGGFSPRLSPPGEGEAEGRDEGDLFHSNYPGHVCALCAPHPQNRKVTAPRTR
jgi:hypothetical protein